MRGKFNLVMTRNGRLTSEIQSSIMVQLTRSANRIEQAYTVTFVKSQVVELFTKIEKKEDVSTKPLIAKLKEIIEAERDKKDNIFFLKDVTKVLKKMILCSDVHYSGSLIGKRKERERMQQGIAAMLWMQCVRLHSNS